MLYTIKEIYKYISESRNFTLATSDEEGKPQIRTMGGYGAEGADIYFATLKTSAKVKQLKNNPETAVLIQHEGQSFQNFINVTVYGKAELLSGEEFDKGLEVIHSRRPELKINSEAYNVYKLNAREVKILDFSKENQISIIKADDLK